MIRWAVAVLVSVLGAAAPAVAQVSDRPPSVSAYTLTRERLTASSAALVGLSSAVIGGVALARTGGRRGAGNGRGAPMLALTLGTIALIAGGVIVTTADGGVGTGNGFAGGIAAIVVGSVGSAFGWLVLARSRRTTR